MNDVHEYFDNNGLKWERIFTVPNATIDSVDKMDPTDRNKFVDVTRNKKGTVGDMWDLSADLSRQREEKYGIDKLKEAHQNHKDNKKKNRNKKLLTEGRQAKK